MELDDHGCEDGFCVFNKDAVEKKPTDIFFAPVQESAVCEDSRMRQKFIQFCEDNPGDEQCRIYDV